MKGDELTEPLTNKIVEKLNDARPDQLPQCHLKIIIRRFINGRIHWWLNQETEENKDSEKDYLKSEAMSSKTQKSKEIGNNILFNHYGLFYRPRYLIKIL